MRKLLAAIFGSTKNTETIVEGAVNGLDALVFTDEEKAEVNAKLGDWFLRYLQATQPQNLSRRLIAVIVVALWALLILVAVAAYQFSPAFSQFIFDTLSENVNTPFSIIIGFYFATHLARAWQTGK